MFHTEKIYGGVYLPKFLTEYIDEINKKSGRIKDDFENREINKEYEEIFKQ